MKTFTTPKGTQLQILDLRGKDYLEVKFRLVWFREERPLWSIETEMLQISDKSAICRAIIKDEQGRIIATAHKEEHTVHFQDKIEKAETSSIGRALALIGFGTQFCSDELDEGERLADAPVQRQNPFSMSSMQPAADDGDPGKSWGYTIPFGKFKMKSLEEIGPKDLSSYVNYLENKAEKDGKEITGVVKDFITRASEFIASFENSGN